MNATKRAVLPSKILSDEDRLYLDACHGRITLPRVNAINDSDTLKQHLRLLESASYYIRTAIDITRMRYHELNPAVRAAVEEVQDAFYRKQRGYRQRAEERKVVEITQRVRRQVEREIFDTLTIRGKKIGDIWSNEFDAYRKAGAFEAALFQKLAQHARTQEPIKVRDLVSLGTLTKMVKAAEKEAGL